MSSLTSHHNERLATCWTNQDCQSCLANKAGCGWCPNSAVCIPASNLLEPLKHAVCSSRADRFELRTKALGCSCSTMTLLSILTTVLCTLLATLIFYGIWKTEVLQWIWRVFGPGSSEGWERVHDDDGVVKERLWRRGGPRWKLRLFSGMADDEDSLAERTRLLRQ